MAGELMDSVLRRAVALQVPITAHVDLTYRCNERCIHCYLHHEPGAELSTTEVERLLGELAEAGTLFLTLSGGEIFLRPDVLDIITSARRLGFSVKLKTNGTLITPRLAERLKRLCVQEVDISIYSPDAAVHDHITKLSGSLRKSLDAVNYLHQAGLQVRISNVLMRENAVEARGVRELAGELGVGYNLDPTVTPMIDGNQSVMQHKAEFVQIRQAFMNFGISGRLDEHREVIDAMSGIPCSAGHCLVYINPQGEIYPCVQFPVLCGDVRNAPFGHIWKNSAPLRAIRAIRTADLPQCSRCRHVAYCTRCPGLALMEGDLCGPSLLDCEKAEAMRGARL